MRQMRKAFFVEKGQPPEAAPAVRIILLRGAAAVPGQAQGHAVENFIA